MPKFALQVKAQLQGVGSFSVNDADYPWHITLRCGSCGEQSEKPVVVSQSDDVEGIRGASVNLKISCKLCKRVNDLTILAGASTYTSEDAPEWRQFLAVEARGTEPVAIEFCEDAPLCMKGDLGFEAEDAFIAGGEYYGYDEKLGKEMVVTEFETRIVKA
jgi:hypothetical protein